jgi:hypothetical protein
MNIKRVISAVKLYESLNDDEVMMVGVLRALTPTERELLVESLLPQKVVKKRSAQPRVYERCSQCGKTKGHSFHKDTDNDGYHVFQSSKPKSQRAASLASAISSTSKPALCTFVMDNGDVCQGTVNDAIHFEDAGYAGYHRFQPPQQASAATGD